MHRDILGPDSSPVWSSPTPGPIIALSGGAGEGRDEFWEGRESLVDIETLILTGKVLSCHARDHHAGEFYSCW